MMKAKKQPNRKRTYLSLAVVLLFFVMGLSGSPRVSADPLRQGQTTLVSHYPDGSAADGGWASVSSDGRYVAFESFDKLTPDKTDTNLDVFVKDMQTGQITRIPAAPVGWHHMHPSISGNGTKVAYLSGPCCYGIRAYVYDFSTGMNRLLSSVVAGGSFIVDGVTLSRDGKWAALDLSGSDAEHALAVSDVATGATRWITGTCFNCIWELDPPSISATGRFVAFQTYDGFYDSADEQYHGSQGVYLYDRDVFGSGTFDQPGNTAVTLVSMGYAYSFDFYGFPAVSDDGRKVAFVGNPWGGVGGNLAGLVLVRDLTSGTTFLVSQSSQGVPGASAPLVEHGDFALAISGDGTNVAFQSLDPHLAPGDLNPQRDVFLRDLGSNTTKLVSYLPDGTQGVGDRYQPALSQDGRFIAFTASTSYDARLGYGAYRPEAIGRMARRVYIRDLQALCSVACLLP